MKLSRILCKSGIYDARIPQEKRFCTVNPMCQVSPHQAMRVEKKVISRRPRTMTAMDCATESPSVRKVLGDCQLLMFKDDRVQYPKKRNQSALHMIELSIAIEPRSQTRAPARNSLHVRLSGGKGIRSLLLHESVCSCLASSP